MPIKPSSPGSSQGSPSEYDPVPGAAATSSSSRSAETSLAHKRDAVLQLTPLQIKRRSRDKTGDDGLRFNANLAALGAQGLQASSSGLESTGARPASASSLPASYQRSLSIPEPVRRSRSTPAIRRDFSGLGNAVQMLNEERRHKSRVSTDLPLETISPHLAAMLRAKSSNEFLINRITAMKPGSAEIQEGFLPVKLARSFDSLSPDKPAKRLLGSGAYGTAYAVRLSENFFCNGIDHGREFVFKAMLCTNPSNPIPRMLYARLPDGHHLPIALAVKVLKEKVRICKEFQIAASLAHTARVMQVYGLVQIGDEFGILAEKINGETVRDLLKKSVEGLRKGVITPQEHLGFAGQVVADVLIGLSRFADEGVTHLDVSHNNVLYDKDKRHFKLIDMGKGREEGEAKEMGTRGYIDICTSTADQKSDVYSAGQLLVHFLRDPGQVVGLTGLTGELSIDSFPFMSELEKLPAEDKNKVVGLINRMIKISVAERPTAQEILRDPFLKNLAPPDNIHECYERLDRLPDSLGAGKTPPRSLDADGSTPATSSAGTERT